MATITIVIKDVPDLDGYVAVETTEPSPAVGRSNTPAQAVAMDVLRELGKRAQQLRHGVDEPEATRLVRTLLDPDGFGWSVPKEVREEARRVLGMRAPVIRTKEQSQ